jgi:probable rRNA maturation factor
VIKDLKINSSEKIYLHKAEFHKVINLLKKEMFFNIDSLNINIVNSEYIFELNSKYLNHNYTTDIITFNYSEHKDRLDGEIFISLHEAIFNSKKYKISLDNEILRLIIHGVLHLLGFDDLNAAEKKVMKSHENKFVKLFENQKLMFIKNYD